ncbi:MAG: RNA polymerase sigma factor, RpoD/SigA family [Cyanobacteria bacterium P01_F01_bin.150]
MNSFGFYLQEIGRIPMLTHEEEITHGKMVKALSDLQQRKAELAETLEREPTFLEWANAVTLSPDQLQDVIDKGQHSKQRMVEANLRLVVSIAKKYSKSGMDIMDLVQEGTVGLQRGVEKFDPSKGYRFSTYAYWWIRQGITRAIAGKSRTVRLPIHVNDKLSKVHRIQSQLMKTLGRPATLQEVADQLQWPVSKVRDYLQVARKPISLDLQVGDNRDTTLASILEDDGPSPEDYVAHQALRSDLRKLINTLTPRQQEVIYLRFGIETGEKLSFAKIGTLMGVSRESIRQIEREALKRLRQRKDMIYEYLAS